MNRKNADNKKQAPADSGAAFFQPSSPPQEEEDCAVCLEILPVDSNNFVRLIDRKRNN